LRPVAFRRLSTLASTVVLLAGLGGCADTFRLPGSAPAAAAARADQMFEAIAARFAPNDFSAKYDLARVKLAQSALVPSRVFNDTSAWDAQPSASMRLLYISGNNLANGHYRLDTRPVLGPPLKPGETRHTIALEQLASNIFRWDTRVDLAIGSITADDIANALTMLLAAPEGRGERAVRDDYRAAFPRTTTAFGRGFVLDSMSIAPGAAGTTNVILRFAVKPELMRPAYPQLADYLDKYLGPAKYHFALGDHAGAPLFDIVGRDRAMTLRYRVQQGKLVSLLGPPKPWPDSLVLRTDLTLKVKHFTVGFRGLVTDFVISNSGSERAWTVLARREPDWDLPFITERLIRSPLHRPFEPPGALFRMSVRDSAGMQTLFTRRTRLDVQESAIMRFIGSLASHAMGDLDAKVEADEDRFIRDLFTALQADLKAQAPRWRKDN
jgi:hypothetical protein